jgi:hypothetical protein
MSDSTSIIEWQVPWRRLAVKGHAPRRARLAGAFTKLKLLRRQLPGRARFDWLRRRVLLAV